MNFHYFLSLHALLACVICFERCLTARRTFIKTQIIKESLFFCSFEFKIHKLYCLFYVLDVFVIFWRVGTFMCDYKTKQQRYLKNPTPFEAKQSKVSAYLAKGYSLDDTSTISINWPIGWSQISRRSHLYHNTNCNLTFHFQSRDENLE